MTDRLPHDEDRPIGMGWVWFIRICAVIAFVGSIVLGVLTATSCGVTSEDIELQQRTIMEEIAAQQQQAELQRQKVDLIADMDLSRKNIAVTVSGLRAMSDRGVTEEDQGELAMHVTRLEQESAELDRIYTSLVDAVEIDAELLATSRRRMEAVNSHLDELSEKTWMADLIETMGDTMITAVTGTIPTPPEGGWTIPGMAMAAGAPLGLLGLGWYGKRKVRQAGVALMGGARTVLDGARRLVPAARAELDARLPVQPAPPPEEPS